MKPAEVKAHRERLGLTQAALAERLSRTPVTISHWETGKYKIDARSAEALKTLKRDEHRMITVAVPNFEPGTTSTASTELFVIAPSSREQAAAIRVQLTAMGAKKV